MISFTLTLVVCCEAGSYALAQSQDKGTPEPVELQVSRTLEIEIGPQERKSFSISMTGGTYARALIDQNGADLSVSVISPEKKLLAEVDQEKTWKNAEIVEIAAADSGDYVLIVKPVILLKESKRFSIVLTEKRVASAVEVSLQAARDQYHEALRDLDSGRFEEAADLAKRSLDTRFSLLPEGSRDTLAAMYVVSLASSYTAKTADGVIFAEREKDLAAKAYGVESLEYADAVYVVGRLKFVRGELAEAEKLTRESLTIRERKAGSENRLCSDSHLNLGTIYRALNDYPKAEKENLRAVEIREQQFGPDHGQVAAALNNLGLMYYGLGDYKKAESTLRRALAPSEKNGDTPQFNTGRLLNNLGLVQWKQRDLVKATETFERALGVYEKVAGPESEAVAGVLLNLGIIYRESGNFPKAEEYYKRVLDRELKKTGEYSIATAIVLSSLGIMYNTWGRYAEAEPYLLRAADVYEKVAGPFHENTVSNYQAIARLYGNMGNVGKALEYYKKMDAVDDRVLAVNATVGSERQKLAYFNSLTNIDRVLSLNVQLAPNNREATELAVKKILQRKGRVIDFVSGSNVMLKQRLDERGGKLVDEMNDINAQLSRLVTSNKGQRSREEVDQLVEGLESKRETIEAGIARASQGHYQAPVKVTLENVRNAIPADAVLLEFVVYEPFDGKAKDQNFYGEPRYLVYVVRREGNVTWVDLGDAKAIDDLITDFRNAISDPKNNEADSLARLVDTRIMKRVRPLIGNATRLLISPDGQLNLIPFEAMLDENGKYLVENFSVTYLGSGRDLLGTRSQQQASHDPVVFANPAFGPAQEPATDSSAKIKPTARRLAVTVTRDLNGMYFPPLAATAKEGESITQMFPNTLYFTGQKATEAEIKHLVSPRILHIATHGFYLRDDDTKGKNALPANPLLRSGLAFAGANVHTEIGDDGVLTSLEASGLDLWGTKLVVLSACSTGLGDVRNGEGVYGLRRAFVIAGAESIVMSLWPVSDYLTRESMVGYYTNLKDGLGRGESLRKVQLDMLRRPGRRHPFYWASFIQSGEWANLDGKR